MSGATVVVGAPGEASSTTGVDSVPNYSADISGAAYVFDLNATAPPPEIAIEQAGTVIASGGLKVFGLTAVSSTSDLTFIIKNIGIGDLTLTGTPKVAVTGSSNFTVIAQPSSPITGPSGSATFIVRFAPTSTGTKTAAIQIANNDADENPYDINLTGVTTAPAITIQPVGSSIHDGETAGLSVSGRVGVAFNASISAAGTVSFYDASALPFGISLNAQTGVISGIPVEPGTHVIQVWGVNAQGTGEFRAVTFVISSAVGTPAFSGDTVLRAIEGQAFSHLITTAPAATAFAADGLPSGWSFNPLSGLLQATPLLGNHDLEIEAWNAVGSSGKQSFQVRVFADAKELWLDEKSGDQAGDPAVAGWDVDPDFDGLSNLLEFAFGLNPNSGASVQFPPAQRVAGNFVISFTEPAGITGITYGAEWSPDLTPASWLPVLDTGTGTTHTFSIPTVGSLRKFMRLKVTSP